MNEESILHGTKKVLGLPEDYTVFDFDILMHINSVFAKLNQMGIGPVDGFEVEDETVTWDHFLFGNPKFNFIKTYLYLSVRLIFDPPATSFVITAMEKQRDEFEWRLSVLRETGAWIYHATNSGIFQELDGGNANGA